MAISQVRMGDQTNLATLEGGSTDLHKPLSNVGSVRFKGRHEQKRYILLARYKNLLIQRLDAKILETKKIVQSSLSFYITLYASFYPTPLNMVPLCVYYTI